jgi:anaerobic ribonucleoside-triphosphate reductase activating protein
MGMGATLNLAAFCPATRVLGPGLRAVVWVQGCPFNCDGCVAPDWIPDRPAQRLDVEALAQRILAGPPVTGLTFSGGEPMRQAGPLAALVRRVRAHRDVDLLVFTGYRLEALRRRLPADGVGALLAETDILIDGLYEKSLDDGRGLRGSSNQRIHALTGRLRAEAAALADAPRQIEVRLETDGLLMVGVPAAGMIAAFDAVSATMAQRLGAAPP